MLELHRLRTGLANEPRTGFARVRRMTGTIPCSAACHASSSGAGTLAPAHGAGVRVHRRGRAAVRGGFGVAASGRR
ncbi:hypothetical protein [Longimicrobium sp.]|jgi:hypothetical protein|uniref:hypothetical protein n=1 Tax=Longimicrobium sp. TaxID=2029185 RepID=UPI002F9416BD